MCVILQKAVFSIVTRMLLVTMFGRDWMKPIFVKTTSICHFTNSSEGLTELT